jgi:hypothetical protein
MPHRETCSLARASLSLAGLLVAYYEGEITRYLIALRRK